MEIQNAYEKRKELVGTLVELMEAQANAFLVYCRENPARTTREFERRNAIISHLSASYQRIGISLADLGEISGSRTDG